MRDISGSVHFIRHDPCVAPRHQTLQRRTAKLDGDLLQAEWLEDEMLDFQVQANLQ